MSEIKKFLRYTIPGLIFGVEYALLIFFSNPIDVRASLGPNLKDIINAGSGVVGLLAAGGISFIFSAIYHDIVHIGRRLYIPYVLGIDYLKVIKAAEKKYLISFEVIEDDIVNNIKADDLTQSGAWRILCSYWNSNFELSQDTLTHSLADLLHATGTILVANIVAILAWCGTMPYFKFDIKFWCAGSIATALFLIHLFNYIFVMRDCDGVIKARYLQELLLYKEKHLYGSTRLLVSKKDIEYACVTKLKKRYQSAK